MTPEDYEEWIKNIELKFLPDLGELQEAVVEAADHYAAWLKANLSKPRSGPVLVGNMTSTGESPKDAYERCKENLRRAVYGE